MDKVQEAMNSMGVSIEKIADIGQNQAISIEKIVNFIEEIQEMAKRLNQFANKL